ncbi:DNA-dependent ATPase FUN30 Ecym_2645 [Eremothecium cymbalariae DBVPG|uniref:DNA helicase n=1 Tax=Eremothecium cymbalariae (strain CBS 270.75 / DBVPG 7215 / KCTC 17166 / NRRL Y-17582) TaxID=931890 RepID=G8JNT2_ERECY|nr:Hypothetical protein Ecym_2645 [Eremothecium cymbalariae DBVPG\
MDPDTPESTYENSDKAQVQVPESSPIESKQDSSPLKAYTPPAKRDKPFVALLHDKFTYKPNISNGHVEVSGNVTGTSTGVDTHLNEIRQHYPDFSDTLIRAVFKSNSFSIPLTIDRLNELREKKMAKSWAMPSKKIGSSTSRLPSLKRPSSSGSMTGGFDAMSSASAMKQHVIVASPERSSKITLEKQKKSIFDRYSHVMHRGKLDPNEPLQIKTIPWQADAAAVKKRKLVRADNIVTNPKKVKKDKISLSDEDEDEISADEGSADEFSGDDYEERTPEVNIDDQILIFLNEADSSDIADLADTSIEKAQIVVTKRPFKSLNSFSMMDFAKNDKAAQVDNKKTTRRRGPMKKDGAKMLEKITQSMKGYNAIESLIKKCSSYGVLIANQIRRWGVKVEENGSGELTFVDLKISGEKSSNSDGENGYDKLSIQGRREPTEVSSGKSKRKRQQEDGISIGSIKERQQEEQEEDEDEEEEEEYEDDEEFEDVYEDSGDEEFVAIQRKNNSGRNRGRPEKKDVSFFRRKPKLLGSDVILKDYQQTGINWLNLLYQNNLSCILADEMGLGKTCQVISFLAYLKELNERGPHLIVVPSSTLENWLREFNKFCPQMKIEPYYGSQQERAELREILEENDGQYDVIVTTYNLASGNKADVSFLKNRNFNVVVYDEGHMLKNSTSERFTKLMKIRANFRLLLTGTPLQNNLRELMSLLEFIMPSLFVSKKEELAAVFKQRAKTSDSNKDYNPLLAQEAIDRAKTMMKPFILRRRKDQVLKHLPAKINRINYCDMNAVQKFIYNKEIRLVMEHKRMLKEGLLPADAKERAVVTHSTSKNLIMALRKASLHPLLFRHIYNDKMIHDMSDRILDEPEYAETGNREYIREDMSYMSDFELHKLCCKFPNTLADYQLKNNEWMSSGKVETLSVLLRDIIDRKREKVLVFSLFTQVLDILELVLSTLNIKFLRLDGSTQVNDRQAIIDKFHEDPDISVFILSTKAGGFGINLVCANNVIIFDQSFNPHDDSQAADRAHRVGQTKDVVITTLIARNSIEEKILQLAKNKLALDTSISAEDSKNKDDDLETRVSDLLEDIIYDEHTK